MKQRREGFDALKRALSKLLAAGGLALRRLPLALLLALLTLLAGLSLLSGLRLLAALLAGLSLSLLAKLILINCATLTSLISKAACQWVSV